ncbi:MAG: hypothetical protein ACOC80_12815, partial [Petrotogales bacterium]
IAGIPRCGTTLMARAVAGLETGELWPSRQEPVNGVIKRHLKVSKADIKNACGCIFLFGNIPKAVISTKRTKMDKKHFENCLYNGDPENINIIEKDYLNYEKIFDFWTKEHSFPVLVLRFEKLWNYKEEIEWFISTFMPHRNIDLPPKKERHSRLEHLSSAELDTLCKAYASLILKTEKMPNVKLIKRRTL